MPDLPWFVYAMLLAPLGLILVAAIYKTLQVRAAREWPSTPGRVVVSNSELRDVKVIDSERGRKLEQRNFANITYEYSVSGQKLRNNRVSIGEDRGNFQVAETIAKYPVGTEVTVYYNSRHPREAVLERDLPQGLWGCLGIATAIAVVGVFGASIGLTRIVELVSTRVANPQMSVPAVALAGFGLVAALFALVLRRQSALAKTWPVVPGVIKLSGLDEYCAAPSDSGRRGSIMYERKVSYCYHFKEIAYTAVHGSFSSNSKTTSRWVLRLFGMDFQDGAGVKVWVNPINPSEATLNPGMPFGWLLWLVALGLWTAAYLIATAG
ncbi:MAG: DUF3592 domain-containing protein [Bradyrhizobium sp.]|uniref:DUF3592 domain-containing protein n=1 Tax=Bradyrhizobium sp. TaxID=376 RepID=UPI0027206DC1|nr:DUF3592 domain-containing protein [Bradyrhizobium sp.]MDO8396581.1 DUF3592 domain-containing protein [Bradyrhizobium sp.]